MCLVLNAGVIVDCLETSLYIYDSQTVGVRSMQLSYLFRNIYIYIYVCVIHRLWDYVPFNYCTCFSKIPQILF